MRKMLHGTYIGPVEEWKGEGALLQPIVGAKVLAQFDNMVKIIERDGKPLQWNWHEFDAADFDIEE